MIIDLRSDTFTMPTPAMREAMWQAPAGDDVFGEDPSVNELEAYTANLFGKEAALYCPSGTMTNQIAINVHTRPGDEVICETLSHVYIYEGGGIAFNSGCQVKPITGHRGMLTAGQVEAAINPHDIHKARTRVVSLENTTNRGGGACYLWSELEAIGTLCKKHGLAYHLDGARLWNALVARGENAAQYGHLFDSISVCLSKGLGAPVGSVLVGSSTFIQEARRVRKKFGGGMRQAGFIAAAGLFALQHHVARLAEDHTHTRLVAEALKAKSWVGEMLDPETNILIFEVKDTFTAASWCQHMSAFGVKALPIAPHQVRLVFHLDVTPPMVEKLIEIIGTLPA